MKFSAMVVVSTLVITGGGSTFIDMVEAEPLVAPPARYSAVMSASQNMMSTIKVRLASETVENITK